MREIKHEIGFAKERVEKLKGIPVRLRVNRGRNKTSDYIGEIRDNYAAVFTFRTKDELMTFSYNDLLTKNILIFKVD